MNFFRSHWVSKAFAFLTGLVFLNMSFFLTEVRMLNINHDLIENIAKLVSGAGLEEERDTCEDTTTQGESKTGGLDFYLSFNHAAGSPYFIIGNIKRNNSSSESLASGCTEIVTPPPKG